LATGDYDNDGRIDVLIVDIEGEPLLLHNESKNANPWVGLKLIGSRSNRDGYGAQITLEVGDKKLVRHCHSDGSYLSASDPRVHFGIGTETAPLKIDIRWPSGTTQTLTNVKPGQYTTIIEGQTPK
jgi:enediyne biosynthesis protein E4